MIDKYSKKFYKSAYKPILYLRTAAETAQPGD